jgi:NAD(P)-dependent dehydrogenase (short-subunit alcohol dehydrogenase family)
MKLQNKTAIVTGAGQGIGLGIAKSLAKEGCNVVVSDINEETCNKAVDEIKASGGNAIGVVCNVASANDVGKLVYSTIEKFGQLDILVNNAGIYPFKGFLELTEDDWDKVMNVNLKGVFLCSQLSAKVMKAGARIINISSIASFVAFQGLVHYCTTKGGVNSFTRALAVELAPQGINVNAVAPGAIDTPGAASTDAQTKGTLTLIPLNRMGQPEDIAGTVTFLASEDSSYITGQVITVDGGWIVK